MKTTLAFLLALPFLAFAAEKYGVYDAQGSRLSTFEVKAYDELLEKTRQIKSDYPGKIVYVSSMQKGKMSKPASRYRFKAEAGAYIEASRKETFAVCPAQEMQGTWISEYSVYLDAKNCLSVQTPNLAGTFRILFLENGGRTDTVQVLVDQSYIQMGDYSHKVWVTDLEYERCFSDDVCAIGPWRDSEENGRYENRSYSQPLIVDKTKFTVADAWYYSRIDTSKIIFSRFQLEKEYKNVNLEESQLPLTDCYYSWLANERSKKEGLDSVYRNEKIDTSASGYRLPFDDEWFFLMRAGASTRYYWGNEENSKTVSQYEWINPVGLKPVAKLSPNGFGLYDMMGIAKEYTLGESVDNQLSPERAFVEKIRPVYQYWKEPDKECELKRDETEWKCTKGQKLELVTVPANYTSCRLLRKTPKLRKLEKF